jgi:antitoxin (DNA-binding transcriptional repressor) of toxin-antitoxin stability system
MDAVENGETVVITRNGTPVAELRPLRRRQFALTAEVVKAIHGLGRPNYAAMREEADVLFGEDRVGG